MNNLEHYKEIGSKLIDELKLTTYPVAVRLVAPDESVPANVLKPLDVFGSEVTPCLTYTWCSKSGFSFFLTKNDIACKPISIGYFGLEKITDGEYLYKAWEKKAAYKRNANFEKKSREYDAKLPYGEIKGLVISPLHQTIIKPHLVMIYCTPLVLSHLILAATYDGDCITSRFNGMEASCKEGIIRTYITNECQVVSPGMGDRVMAGVQDNEMIFSIPESKLELIIENLFLAGKKIERTHGIHPFKMPSVKSIGPITFFGKSAEPEVWNLLRKKIIK
ncbi:MAG: DUF169 domain-containing protein [Promethearchaeota archaeon]